jgi:hypothetical protein
MHKIRSQPARKFSCPKQAPSNPVAPLAASTLIILFVKIVEIFQFKLF